MSRHAVGQLESGMHITFLPGHCLSAGVTPFQDPRNQNSQILGHLFKHLFLLFLWKSHLTAIVVSWLSWHSGGNI